MSPKVSKPFVTSLFVLKNDLSVFSVEKLALGIFAGSFEKTRAGIHWHPD